MPKSGQSTASHQKSIRIRGARVHNLKNISLELPRNRMIVITGLSGSGKSSLAFDTLYAEGQRRYVESLSAYARQFLGKLDKPEVDQIKGIAPAIAIEQKVVTRNSRSTVGTTTEVYEYLKLLFARIGRTFSPVSGNEVKRHTASDVVDYVDGLKEKTKLILYSPLPKKEDRTMMEQLKLLLQQGYTRVKYGDEVQKIEQLLDDRKKLDSRKSLWLVVDRFMAKPGDEENQARIADSVETAFFEGDGEAYLETIGDEEQPEKFSNKFELDGITFEQPSEHFFSFNNPVGACKTCEGFGHVLGIDPDLVIPDKSKSIYDDAVVCWKGEKMSAWKRKLVYNADKFDFPVHRPYHDLTVEQKELIWTGNKYFKGLNAFFRHLEKKSYKIQFRVMLSRYRGRTTCPDCKGTRLRKDAQYVKIDGRDIVELVTMPISRCRDIMANLDLNAHDQEVADRLLMEIQSRLTFLTDVGLGYLTLNRMSNTLSGGESQRIRLATSLGSSLVGSMYILDEPSIGLHPRDTQQLITVLRSLQRIGNTVIVVEHDEEMMKAADQIVDMGPMAGNHGGEVVFQGDHKQLVEAEGSLTADYLTGRKFIDIPSKRRPWKRAITIEGARQHNLKNLDVDIPLEVLTVVSGVSGSGKSTLIGDIFYPALGKHIGGYGQRAGEFSQLSGDLNAIDRIEFVDQNPIGKSSRSNPVTYAKAFDEIRALFAQQKLAKMRGLKPGHFSFNTKGGRCETCEGEGEVKIEMQFMADIHLVCEDCKGLRYKPETLEIKYRKKHIADVLSMTIDEALGFFAEDEKSTPAKRIVEKLTPLQDVGLGYLQLGQSSSTLSGGEAQRVKLATFLGHGSQNDRTFFIFDEPTTGLHFHDVQNLLKSFDALIKNGHTVLVIEHDPDVIKSADWIIDLGPEGGEEGGDIVFAGTPEDLARSGKGYTSSFIKAKLDEAVSR